MDVKVKEVYEKTSNRMETFKNCGFDIQKEIEFIIEKSQPIKGKILEIGTGKGYFACALAKNVDRFTSVDVSEETQNIAKMNMEFLGLKDKVEFLIQDAENLQFDDDSFDMCFAVNVVHHLEQPLKVLEEIVRVTAPGGKIVLADFNRQGLSIIGKIHEKEGGKHHSGLCTLNETISGSLIKIDHVEKLSLKCQDIFILTKKKN